MRRQANTVVDDGADSRAFEVGRALAFEGYNPEEIPGETFRPGDLLIVEPTNGGGFGIVARRHRDGVVDMVWPEEVDVL